MSLRAAFLGQAQACAGLGSPFMEQLLRLLANRLTPETEVGSRLYAWDGDLSASGQSVPLRLAGALHRLVLEDADAPLTAAYPPNSADDDALWGAVAGALERHGPRILTWLLSPPQTNEVRRAAVLIAAGHMLTERFGLPLMVSELGASAGLNLNWDRFALEVGASRLGPVDAKVILTPAWHGHTPPSTVPQIVDRRGVDLSPVDPANPSDRIRLQSYLWPDQPHRRVRTIAAMDLPPARVDRADAIDWLAKRLGDQPDGTTHMVYHTIAWQYFPRAKQVEGLNLLKRAGASATPSRPLARFAMEADALGPGAGLYMDLWPDGTRCALGRADFHGRWVRWSR